MIKKNVIVIGGGAAGFFAAINLAEKNKNYNVSILEKSNKLLSKVKISGGGRCNVTNACFENSELVKNYPRGNKELKQVFSRFNVSDTIQWFENHDVSLKTEEDGRIFPQSDDSETIVNCFLKYTELYHIKIEKNCEVFTIKKIKEKFYLNTSQGEKTADQLIIALGGHPKSGSYDLIKNLGHNIVSPIPSLFTLNLPNEKIKNNLQGLSVQNAEIKLVGQKLKYAGPVLITHWGLSGPAVLKLSAFAAHELFALNYSTKIQVNWAFPNNRQEVEALLFQTKKTHQKSLVRNVALFDLPKRLWEHFCLEAVIEEQKTWQELNNKQMQCLCDLIFCSTYNMEGKTTFKEEFVTCGGVDLKEIDFKTMESKLIKGLFFCGEVINVDGITGGFNFQNAWSTAWICADSLKPYPNQ
ncbi:MAG: NAD(P)/FAD-dependent oxidoreductase [Sphingobacteriaceae bacterium]|nr:NAD(P)/FAD-dependent oxidoreductase [Sphingobacteriaceae bacterium]